MRDAQLRGPILLSIAAALITLGLKSAAYALSGSAGLFTDALESLINLAAAVAAFFSLWYSAQPADPEHTYGHEKIEYFSSGLEGMLVLGAACGGAYFAFRRLFVPQPLEALGLGLAIAIVASLINLAVATVLLRVGRARRSIVLEADGQHLMSDVWTTVAVLVALALVWLTGWEICDPLIALIMSVVIAMTGFKLIARSFHGLMDHALAPADQATIRDTLAKSLPAGVTYHALRTRQAGASRFADFHLLVPGAWPVQQAHDLAETVEVALGAALPGLNVTTHIEPIEEPASYGDHAPGVAASR